MRVTDVQIFPAGGGDRGLEAEVELDGLLVVRGIRIRRGRCGDGLEFPGRNGRDWVDLRQPALVKAVRRAVFEKLAVARASAADHDAVCAGEADAGRAA